MAYIPLNQIIDAVEELETSTKATPAADLSRKLGKLSASGGARFISAQVR